MSEPESKPKKKKKKKAAVVREERWFTPVLSNRRKMFFAAGGVGALVLGAGVYAQFRQQFIAAAEGPMPNGSYILGAGAVILAALVLTFPEAAREVAVGDGGVAELDANGSARRIFWCDVKKIELANGVLSIKSKNAEIKMGVEEHPAAVAWVVREAEARVEEVVKLSESDRRAIGDADQSAGEIADVPPPQIAGRRCKESGGPITYEEDARLCPTCGETYHKDHVPEECGTCGAKISDGGIAVA